ncbi:stage V sporulation protein AB [Cellulosilyticum sp. I15G10I2]|uniref:stage V sporulation protein AB n=1 Tax=Cellulosilyticum sp. I15G10I2 TaxID=1892843 RepID=UPI00085CD2EF|nr:stage V sporulation protein AB [Cellulosilyticum sp. I15G10I2]
MQEMISKILQIIWGLGIGIILSGGIIAFITIIGIIPLMAHRTQTSEHHILYGSAIMLGTFIGSVLSIWPIIIPVSNLFIGLFGLTSGIFTGVLIIALAEVLDVFPISDRRIKIKKGVTLMVFALAIGKLIGSLYFWLYPIFTELS